MHCFIKDFKVCQELKFNSESGICCHDIVSNAGALSDGQFIYDDEENHFECNAETYYAWQNYLNNLEFSEQEKAILIAKVRELVSDSDSVIEKIEQRLVKACNCEMFSQPKAVFSEIEDIREEFESRFVLSNGSKNIAFFSLDMVKEYVKILGLDLNDFSVYDSFLDKSVKL